MHSPQILIKDPYLSSAIKPNYKTEFRYQSSTSQPFNQTHQTVTRDRAVSDLISTHQRQNQNLRQKLNEYQHKMTNLSNAYGTQQHITKKIMNYNAVNHQYHDALKHRNYDLNNKLSTVNHDMKIISNKFQEDHMKFAYDKEMLLDKYKNQCEEVLSLKRTINGILQQKTHNEQQFQHLTFTLEKTSHQYELTIKQQSIRLQNLDQMYRNIISTKDQEIGQIQQRLRIYEDQNRRLNDMNRSLQLTKNQRIDMLSGIKERDFGQEKENYDANRRGSTSYKKDSRKEREKEQQMMSQLDKQRTMNDQLQKQLHLLKNRLNEAQSPKKHNQNKIYNVSKYEGLISSIQSLRNGLNKQIFDVFFSSVNQGQKKKSNSLIIFIQNWKSFNKDKLEPYITSYFQSRDALKQLSEKQDTDLKGTQMKNKIEQAVPLKIAHKAGRSNINEWILSTIQFTKNQRQASKKSLNNLLLFLFRLLTIEYRVKYPMQGKSYRLDQDVINQLNHEIIKAIDFILKY